MPLQGGAATRTPAACKRMAGCLIISSQNTVTANLVIPTISRVSSSFCRISFHPCRILSSHAAVSPVRLYCKCSSQLQQQKTVHTPDYANIFARRMAMAGLEPHHRIAIGVSGGPDSIALCVLAAGWKADAFHSVGAWNNGSSIEGLLAVIVDHGLRSESKEEADMVCRRVSDMGIRCEVTRCVWPDGRPKQGHLQEAAREMRYQMFQNICNVNKIGVLLTAHHADDQAELFFIRLSRNSGVLGLAGMAFSSQMYSTSVPSNIKALKSDGILVVRPLLDLSKEDMYTICQQANQEWVEDPSNRSPVFSRNRIRMSLADLPSSFKAELHEVILACRETRSYVDGICCYLINKALTVTNEGYAIVDLEDLAPSKIEDICLSKFVASVLQFISQRQRPVRGSALKLLLKYIRDIPCKTSVTAAGCYLCAAPGSKGTKVLVCCSVNSPPPSKMEKAKCAAEGEQDHIGSEVLKIIGNGKSYLDRLAKDGTTAPLMLQSSSESVLAEARRHNLISESTLNNIRLLQRQEITQFQSNTGIRSYNNTRQGVESASKLEGEPLLRKEIGYFMNRFLVTWNLCSKEVVEDAYPVERSRTEWNMGGSCQHDRCNSCIVDHDMAVVVRHMVDADWLYLTQLSNSQSLEQAEEQRLLLACRGEATRKAESCSGYAKGSAQRALLSLKTVPLAARRSLPVLVNSQGLLLSIPSVCFKHCSCLEVSAVFKPRVPLGGGHSSFA